MQVSEDSVNKLACTVAVISSSGYVHLPTLTSSSSAVLRLQLAFGIRGLSKKEIDDLFVKNEQKVRLAGPLALPSPRPSVTHVAHSAAGGYGFATAAPFTRSNLCCLQRE